MPIPKKIHVSWVSRDVVDSQCCIIVNGLKNLIDLNPEWQVTIYQDEEVDSYLRQTLSNKDYDLVKHTNIVDKTDLWRLLKIYQEGGVYADIDRLCNLPLDSVVTPKDEWILPTCREYDFSHDLMLSSPNNPVFINTALLYLQRRREGWDNTYFLGAQTYMHSITQTTLGQMINTNPGEKVFREICNNISKIDGIRVVREDPPYHTLIYKNDGRVPDWETAKREFYASEGISHWTGEW